ncbi:hypothetical protein Tco_0683278 [Tanacetum coccineum]|uniref:Uncharacterized protein n=1 Tax=Tanacetum coccineum TaxID=301880 RepID=A0ABQ4XTJ2_9ASTR
MQMLYCFVNNIHVDYAELLWEGINYSLHHPASSIPYPRFTKIIISHYMTIFPDISRRARDIYHNLQDDDIMKNIFNSGRNKNKVGMRIPAWMITEEMKQTEHYRMYVEVFGLDVPLTQSQPTESTQGTHRTTSAPRRSTRLTPPASVPTADKADEMLLQDTLQVSLAEHKSHKEQEARENMALVNEHLATAKIDKLVDDSENVIDDSSPPRNNDTTIPDTRLEPMSDKESPKVEITKEKEVEITKETEVEFVAKTVELTSDNESPEVDITKENEEDITNIVPPVNVDDEEDKITNEVYELKRRFMPRKSSDQLADDLHDVMAKTLPSMVKDHVMEQKINEECTEWFDKAILQERGISGLNFPHKFIKQMTIAFHLKLIVCPQKYSSGHRAFKVINPAQFHKQPQNPNNISTIFSYKADPQCKKQDIAIWLALQMKFERTQVPQTACRPFAVRPRDQEDPHDDAHLEGENSAKRQKTSEYEAYVSGESSSRQVNEAATKKEILDSPHPRKATPLVLSCQRNPDAPAISLINQDLLYLKKGNSGPKKIVLVTSKSFPFIFKEDDIEERTSKMEIVTRRANKCIVSITEPDYKNLNKNDIEDIYLLIMNGKVPDYTETRLLWSLSVFIRSSVIWERVHDFQLGIESYQLEELSNDEVEYLKLFEEEIEEQLKYQRQMRRWEMYVNGRPLGPRRERPEIIDP